MQGFETEIDAQACNVSYLILFYFFKKKTFATTTNITFFNINLKSYNDMLVNDHGALKCLPMMSTFVIHNQ